MSLIVVGVSEGMLPCFNNVEVNLAIFSLWEYYRI